ncbi:MAG: NAD(P)-dependent oxidoreductase [Pseudomonadota bacterium]
MSDKVVSILKEQRAGEKRVILLPAGAAKFTEAGYQVLVESKAGLLAGYDDAAYRAIGAEIVDTDTAWNTSDLVFKYKAPGPEEYRYFRAGMHMASFMHAEGNLDLVEAMRASGMSGYALEFFRTGDGDFPVPVSDNEISGKMAIILASYHLQSHMGGRGVLMADVPGAPKAKVVVIGYGNVGGGAARLAAAMGAEVKVFGTNWFGLRQFMATVPANVECVINTPDALEEAVLEADVVVGAILISTYDTPPMVPDDLVARMKKGSVIVDVTCGYGSGYMPSFDKLTTYDGPFYERHGVLHCKIDAMPASVPITAAEATNANVWRYLLAMADGICGGGADPVAQAGCVVSGSKVVHPEVIRHIEMEKSSRADVV